MSKKSLLLACIDALNSKKSIISSSFGSFKVVEVNSWNNVVVKFDSTGYTLKTTTYYAANGLVKDKMFPSIFGVGFIGDGEARSSAGKVILDDYAVWYGMIRRCYDEKAQENQPTYKDCSVNEKWHNFQNFSRWYSDNHPNDGLKYQLDKDKILKGNLIYSEDTCCFLTPQENSEVSKSKTYSFISPEGNEVEIFNMSKHCRDNNLTNSSMFKVLSGANNHHKGWKLSRSSI